MRSPKGEKKMAGPQASKRGKVGLSTRMSTVIKLAISPKQSGKLSKGRTSNKNKKADRPADKEGRIVVHCAEFRSVGGSG